MGGRNRTGRAVAVGDVNGDGYGDIIIGATSANSGAGTVYVVYGGPTRKGGTAWAGTEVMAAGSTKIINGIDGFRLDGVTAGDGSGYSVATGDVNHDGYADVIIGAYDANSSSRLHLRGIRRSDRAAGDDSHDHQWLNKHHPGFLHRAGGWPDTVSNRHHQRPDDLLLQCR